MHNDETVVVFGATGQQGGSVAAALLSQGWHVRAVVRDPASTPARALAANGIETVRGDFADAASLEAAMAGAYGVFSVQPSSGQGAAYGVTDEDEVRYGQSVVDIAVASGVQHLVYSSANAAGKQPSGVGHFDSKARVETHLHQQPVRHTIVRPSAFMEILLTPGLGLSEGRMNFFMRPDQTMQFIAVRDIGRVVARIFGDAARFSGRTIEPFLPSERPDASCRVGRRNSAPSPTLEVASQLPVRDGLVELHPLVASRRHHVVMDVFAEGGFGYRRLVEEFDCLNDVPRNASHLFRFVGIADKGILKRQTLLDTVQPTGDDCGERQVGVGISSGDS